MLFALWPVPSDLCPPAPPPVSSTVCVLALQRPPAPGRRPMLCTLGPLPQQQATGMHPIDDTDAPMRTMRQRHITITTRQRHYTLDGLGGPGKFAPS
mmetsp:Transcript_62220/g.103241  ORF Transcript_62220/g.103241 Transcript_62220/m.103241 type:complete len:97 (-) Transcript_62220:2060-2350(-)